MGKKYLLLVEVKTILRTQDIQDFLKKLRLAEKFFPEYKDRKIIGAVGFLNADVSVTKFATRKGLFLIRGPEDSATIKNRKTFTPTVFN